jgi:hypothetical protein
MAKAKVGRRTRVTQGGRFRLGYSRKLQPRRMRDAKINIFEGAADQHAGRRPAHPRLLRRELS